MNVKESCIPAAGHLKWAVKEQMDGLSSYCLRLSVMTQCRESLKTPSSILCGPSLNMHKYTQREREVNPSAIYFDSFSPFFVWEWDNKGQALGLVCVCVCVSHKIVLMTFKCHSWSQGGRARGRRRGGEDSWMLRAAPVCSDHKKSYFDQRKLFEPL